MNEDHSINNMYEGHCYCGISGVRVLEKQLTCTSLCSKRHRTEWVWVHRAALEVAYLRAVSPLLPVYTALATFSSGVALCQIWKKNIQFLLCPGLSYLELHGTGKKKLMVFTNHKYKVFTNTNIS